MNHFDFPRPLLFANKQYVISQFLQCTLVKAMDTGPEIEGHREENFEQGIEEDENDLEEADIEESS